MAQSLFQQHPMYADKCSQVCPHTKIFQLTKFFERSSRKRVSHAIAPDKITIGFNIPAGYNILSRLTLICWHSALTQWRLNVVLRLFSLHCFSAHGSYCLTRKTPPFCPEYLSGFGDPKCCSLENMFKAWHYTIVIDKLLAPVFRWLLLLFRCSLIVYVLRKIKLSKVFCISVFIYFASFIVDVIFTSAA